MSDQVLNILKLFLLALVWLFFLRVLRSVWVEIRSGDVERAAAGGPGDVASRPGAVPAAPLRGPRSPRQARGPGPSAAAGPGGAGAGAGAAGAGAAAAAAAAAATVARPAVAGAGGRGKAEPGTRLRMVEPADRSGEVYEIDDGTTIGRASRAGIPLPSDSYVSSDHARVYLSQGGLWVEDNGSTNGTFVNSQRITAPTPLTVGDRLQVGRTVFEVCR